MWPAEAAEPLIGMGCMRLSTERDRDEAQALAVLHAAFQAGVTVLDTADAYCLDATESGHNERLIARALAAWSGDRSLIRVATKGGLTRPNGLWIPDGRGKHLTAACEASLRSLGVERIDLYQLHAIDPRTPLSTSVRALDALKRSGLVDAIGLSNVNVGQIEEARRITDIAAVQVEVSVWQDDNLLNGVVEYCVANGIRLLAYRPLGGVKRRKRTQSNKALAEVAARHGASPFEVALAWLRDLSDCILPIPGATRVETVQSIARARTVVLQDVDRTRLAESFPASAVPASYMPGGDAGPTPGRTGVPAGRTDAGEIVLIMGLPGAGKSTLAQTLVDQGYHRVNRDEAGGSLKGLLPALDRAVESGASRIVLDNTYVSRKSRAPVIAAARRHSFAVRCLWLATGIEDAQVNAVERMVSRYGRLPVPEDPGAFGPTVQFRYQRDLEPPHPAEGLTEIEVVPFHRRRAAGFIDFAYRAVVLWCEGVLARSRAGGRTFSSPDDVEVLPGRSDVLRRYRDDGWLLLGTSWQPGIADQTASVEQVGAAFERMRELLGVPIEIEYCPHAGGPPTCWCRKPLPGLGVVFINRHRLDPAQCVYVGNGPQDPGFARRLGFQYRTADEFFGSVE